MTYARIDAGKVSELFTPPAGVSIASCFHGALTWVDVTTVSPAPQVGWTYAGGVFSAPVAPTLTLAQQAGVAIGAGLTITLTGTVTLAATRFPTDADARSKIGSVMTILDAAAAFPDGVATYPMRDASGVWHDFTPAQYKTVAGAIGNYLSALFLIADGYPKAATSLPAASVSLTV